MHDAVARHPHTSKWHNVGQRFKVKLWCRPYRTHQARSRILPFQHPFHPNWNYGPNGKPTAHGHASVQVVRSSADWSLGILKEHSIQNAYIELIREANHCIYIENQL